MSRSAPNFTPFHRPDQRPTAREAMDFLHSHDRVSSLLPTANRLAQLQTACERLQPMAFASCRVVSVSDGLLQVAVPNAALATRLRQQLSKLAASLRETGWPVEEVRLKVQVMAERLPQAPASKKRELPSDALASFAELANALDADPRNEGLRNALQSLLKRRKA